MKSTPPSATPETIGAPIGFPSGPEQEPIRAIADVKLGSAESIARTIKPHCVPLPSLEETEAFGTAFDGFADAKVVLLGEASHGTSEFYRARAAITRRLIEQHGFTIVAVEADWPDAARIDRYVRDRGPGAYDEESFARFPTWMWRNREVGGFIDWLRGFNQTRPERERAEFRGLDVYSLRGSIGSVLDYLDRVDPGEARQARSRYGCLTPWQGDPAFYGRSVLYGERDPCEPKVTEQLQALLAHRLDYAARAMKPSSTRRRTRGSSGRPSSTTASCIMAATKAGICATGTCSTRSRRCWSIADPTRRRWFGRTIPISAMPRPRRWAGAGSSTSVN